MFFDMGVHLSYFKIAAKAKIDLVHKMPMKSELVLDMVEKKVKVSVEPPQSVSRLYRHKNIYILFIFIYIYYLYLYTINKNIYNIYRLRRFGKNKPLRLVSVMQYMSRTVIHRMLPLFIFRTTKSPTLRSLQRPALR